MPALANVVINDGQASPAAHTFAPTGSTGSKAKFADRSPSIPAGYLTISREVVEPQGARSVYRISDGFYMPVVEEVNGSDTVVRYNSAKLELNFHPDATLQERKDMNAYIKNWLANSDVQTSTLDLEPFY